MSAGNFSAGTLTWYPPSASLCKWSDRTTLGLTRLSISLCSRLVSSKAPHTCTHRRTHIWLHGVCSLISSDFPWTTLPFSGDTRCAKLLASSMCCRCSLSVCKALAPEFCFRARNYSLSRTKVSGVTSSGENFSTQPLYFWCTRYFY